MAGENSATPTPYEWADGEEAFRRLIDALYDRVEIGEEFARQLAAAGMYPASRQVFIPAN
ncbi:MAG TPA: hypothetical protein VND98_09850 [Solirubrobacterales bacterium]|nr:hypothetical protein [Solirubrobacterales bacterium]